MSEGPPTAPSTIQSLIFDLVNLQQLTNRQLTNRLSSSEQIRTRTIKHFNKNFERQSYSDLSIRKVVNLRLSRNTTDIHEREHRSN